MPMQAAVPAETIFDNLKNLPIFDEYGQLKKQNDPIWKTAGKLMPETSLKNIYIFVYQNRKDIKSKLMEHQNVTPLVPPPPKRKKKTVTPRVKGKQQVKAKRIKQFDSEASDDEDSEDIDDYDDLNDEEEVRKVKKLIADIQSNDIHALMMMKHSDDYRQIIHQLNYSKFSMMYWDRDQIKFWENCKDTKPLSLIVVGDIISNESMPKEVGNIYLYALAINLEESTILLGQMISESTELRIIKFFLSVWLLKAGMPTEIVVDYCNNILNAACLAFNVLTFDEYNIRCYKYLNNEPGVIIPGTLIQIDIISLIKVVDSWSCFENVLQPVKDFYLCSIMYLSTVTNFDVFVDTVVSVLTICQSPYQSQGTETRRAALWEHLTDDDIQQINQRYIEIMQDDNSSKRLSFLNNREDDSPYDQNHEIFSFIEQLKMQAYNLCDFHMGVDKQTNAYYCPIILDNLVTLLSKFPSWTKIIFTRNECSDLVSVCTNDHLNFISNPHDSLKPSDFFTYHLQKIRSLLQRGKKLLKLT